MLSAYGGIKEEMVPGSKNQTSSDCGVPLPASKPKIWSLADTAACKTPPPIVQSQHGAWMTNPYHPHSHHHSSHNPHSHQSAGISSMMMMGNTPTNHINNMNMSGINATTATPQNTNHPHNTQHQQQALPTSNQQTMAGNFSNNPYSRYTGFLGGSHHYNINTNNTIPHNNNTNNSSNIPVTGPHQIQHPNMRSNSSESNNVSNFVTSQPSTPTHLQQQNSNSRFITKFSIYFFHNTSFMI